MAVSSGKGYRIDFNVLGNSYTISRCDGNADNCVRQFSKSLAAFGGNIIVSSANYGGANSRITFLPRGTALPGSLSLVNSRGSVAQIITSITGRTGLTWTPQ